MNGTPMMGYRTLAIIHAFVTWFLIGLIFCTQWIQYPLLSFVESGGFSHYYDEYVRRIGSVVILPMLFEFATSVVLILIAPTPFKKRVALAGFVMVVLIWLSTWALQVPQHEVLSGGFSDAAHTQLVSSNLWRTFLWSLRGIVVFFLL